MNRTTERRPRATGATKRIEGARAATPQPGWRQLTREHLRSLSAPLQAARSICTAENIGMATYLVGDVQRKVGALYELASDPAVSRHQMLDHMYHLEALLCAAQDIRDGSDTLRSVLQGPEEATGKFATKVLDAGDYDDADLAAATRATESATSQSVAAPAADNRKAALFVFAEIADIAAVMRNRIHYLISSMPADLDEDSIQDTMMLQMLIRQVGLLASIGQQDAGETDPLYAPDARGWLMHSPYNEAIGRAA